MKVRPTLLPYLALILWAGVSMSYYVAGVDALYEIWFHGENNGAIPFTVDDARIDSVTVEAGAAGLAKGDILELLNGRRYTGDAQLVRFQAQARPGDVLEATVRGPRGILTKAQLRLEPRRKSALGLGAFIALLTPMLGVPLLGLLLGYWVVAARPHDLNAWLVLMLLTFPESAFGDIHATWWPGISYVLFTIWQTMVGALAFPALLWFGLFFPQRSRIDIRWPALKWIILATQLYVAVKELLFAYLQGYAAGSTTALFAMNAWIGRVANWGNRAGQIGEAACVILFLAAVFDNLRSASTPDARRRLRVLAVGSGLSLGPLLILFWVLPFWGYTAHYGHLFEVAIPFLALFPLTLAYVLVVQRAMDLRVLVRLGTKYLLAKATVLFAEIALAAILVLRFIVPMMQRKEHQAINIVLLLVVIVLLFQAFLVRGSLSNRLQSWLDRKFFREAYNVEIVLSELSERAGHFAEQGPLIETVSQRISQVLHVPRIAVWLRGGNVFHLQHTLGFDVSGPLLLPEHSATVENLSHTQKPATVYWDRPDEWLGRAGDEEKRTLGQVQAEILLALPGRGRLLGIMALGAKKSEEPYTSTDFRLLQSVATQTGLSLEVSELVSSLASEAALRARSDREMEIAREVQERLFPQRIPTIPGLDLAGACRPALGVGGDYYDMIELENGCLGLAIADVSGKGISAALLMASLRACLRTMTRAQMADLAMLMQQMNHLVYEASAADRYATLFFAVYDPSNRQLNYVNAGHNPPFLLRPSNGGPVSRIRLDAGGLVVGLLPQVEYEARSLNVEGGDLLLAYTDGISETMTLQQEEWGEERMIRTAEAARHGSALEILRASFAAADLFSGTAPQHDDMTLLIAKFQ